MNRNSPNQVSVTYTCEWSAHIHADGLYVVVKTMSGFTYIKCTAWDEVKGSICFMYTDTQLIQLTYATRHIYDI